MHPEAYQWVAAHVPPGRVGLVVECGGRDINGTVRALFDTDVYISVDLHDGPGVDVVADWLTWRPDRRADVVVHCEVAEHVPNWSDHVAHAAAIGDTLILTAAGPGRSPHSAIDGGWHLHPGEHYANVDPDQLRAVLAQYYTDVVVDVAGADVRAWARGGSWSHCKSSIAGHARTVT